MEDDCNRYSTLLLYVLMRFATRKQDWKVVNISEHDRLEKYLTLFFLFLVHIWHWFYLSQLVVKVRVTLQWLCSKLPCLIGAYQL